MPTSAWSLPASSSETSLAERLRHPGPSARAISDSAVLMPPPPLPSVPAAGKLVDHPYMQMARSSQPQPPSPASASTHAFRSGPAVSKPAPLTSTSAPWEKRHNTRASADLSMAPPTVPARSASTVSERRSLFEQPAGDGAQAPGRADRIQRPLSRASDPFALPVTHRRTSDKQDHAEPVKGVSGGNTTSSQKTSPSVLPSPTLASRFRPPSPTASSQSRFLPAPHTLFQAPSIPAQSTSTAPASRLPPPSPTMSQAPWARPQSPCVPGSPRLAAPSIPPSPRPSTPGHRHSASVGALPPPSPRTPGHKVSQSLSELPSLVETPRKPDLPCNPGVWNPSQLAQHLRYSLRSGADGQTLPAPVVEDVVTWIFRHRVDGSGFLAGVEGIGGSRPPFLPVLSIVSRKLRRTSRAQRHAALPLPEDMEEPTRVRRLAHAFESASEAEDDLFALRQQLTGNSIEAYGRATPRTTEKVAWQRHRSDSISSNTSDSRWELSPTGKQAPAVPLEALMATSAGPRLSLASDGQADDELEVRSTGGVRSPSPDSPLLSPRLLFRSQPELPYTPGSDDVPPLSPSSALGDITHVSNLSAMLSPSDLFSPSRDSLPRSPSSPAALKKKGKRVSSTKRLPSTFNDDESRKVTVTPNRRASRKLGPSMPVSPAVDSPLRASVAEASPLRVPGSPAQAPSPTCAGPEPSLTRSTEVSPLPVATEVARPSQADEATSEVEPPVQLILPEELVSLAPPTPATPASSRSSPRHRMEREMSALHDRVRELEERLASVTTTSVATTQASTPI